MTEHKNLNKLEVLKFLLEGSLGLFILSVLAGLAVSLFQVITPQVISITVDSILGDKPVSDNLVGIVDLFGGVEYIKDNLWVVACIIAGGGLVMLVFHYFRMYLTTCANQKFMLHMRNSLFTHLQRLPLDWHSKHQTGDIIQRCTSDADTIMNFVTNNLIQLIRLILVLVLSLVFMFMTDIKLALIAFAFVPVVFGYSLVFQRKIHGRIKVCDEQEGVLSTIAQENLTGVRVVRAFGRERYERDKFENQNVSYTALWVKVLKFMSFYWLSSDFFIYLQMMVIIVVGCVFSVNGSMTAGAFIAFISYNAMLIGPVQQLGRMISNLSKASVSLGRIGEILNGEEEEYGEEAENLTGDIVFDKVSFEYEEGKPVLSDVSFKVPEGSTLGIIGSTGSGKSTIGYLIDRLYAPTSGNIYFGDKNINDISRRTVRSNVGFVLQEGYVYSTSLKENISIASKKKELEDIKHACEVSCVDDNIEKFAKGYDTVVGERGVTLSGGQKQRVNIARTLMRETPYLIFDDSLSAVDSETDTKIRAHLNSEYKHLTTIIIAHRITTVMNADNILVLDGGRIVESGTSEELLKLSGTYKRIYDLQMSLPDDLKEEVNRSV